MENPFEKKPDYSKLLSGLKDELKEVSLQIENAEEFGSKSKEEIDDLKKKRSSLITIATKAVLEKIKTNPVATVGEEWFLAAQFLRHETNKAFRGKADQDLTPEEKAKKDMRERKAEEFEKKAFSLGVDSKKEKEILTDYGFSEEEGEVVVREERLKKLEDKEGVA